MAVKAEQVQNGHEDDCSAKQLELLVLDQLSDSARSVDLISVQRSRNEYHRPVFWCPTDLDGDLHGHPAVTLTNGKLHVT